MIFLITLLPILVGGVLGWFLFAKWNLRRLLAVACGVILAVLFGRILALRVAQYVDAIEVHLLMGLSLVMLFAAGMGGVLMVSRRENEERVARWWNRLDGVVAGLLTGSLVGAMLLVTVGAVWPGKIDAAQLPLGLVDKATELGRFAAEKFALPAVIPGRKESLDSKVEAAPVVKVNYKRFSYDAALARAKLNMTSNLTLNSAFRLSQFEAAKAKAQREGKLLGFIMVWDQFFKRNDGSRETGGSSSLAHFYQVFHDNMVLVFVRHEEELDSVPESVKKGFFGPDEGGAAPNMAVVSADAREYICEIPLGGGMHSSGDARDAVFRSKIGTINAWLDEKAKK